VAYRVQRAAKVTRDFDLIEDYLVQAYQDIGEDLDHAMTRTHGRINDTLKYMRKFSKRPYRGTLHPDIRPDLRTVTNRNFIFYFEIDESIETVMILAVFFGGMAHRRQILDRLREDDGTG
jgi:plasmid stabilization system protein ParE